MKQVIQDIDSGETVLETVPPPSVRPGGIRVRTAASVVSGGTEKMVLDIARRGYIGKALARPDLVRQVWEKIKKEGLWNTYRKVSSRLDEPMPLGYSAAGIVEEVGDDVTSFEMGDRVAVAGAGYANHAEINFVPENLAARVPEGVDLQDAAYATVASIALQGVRQAEPRLGDAVAVIGMGLIGLITVQLLKASGCRVLGIDIDPSKAELAEKLGIDRAVVPDEEDVEEVVGSFSGGYGVDGTIITAATDSNGPVRQAGSITRSKGQVVVVGAVGMDVPRKPYYEKELELTVSRSYGPGRYDPSYEEGGIDYPYDYVRWTEQRNLQASLNLMADGKLDTDLLTTHQFSFDEAVRAYQLLESGDEPHVGIRLDYEVERSQPEVIRVASGSPTVNNDQIGVGFVGAGNYASMHLIPHVRAHDRVSLVGLATATGSSARQKAEKFGFRYSTTDVQALLEDESVDVVFIATRHSTHAKFVTSALESDNHVFVEKPLAVSPDQLDGIVEAFETAQRETSTGLMVGLNRRFAPMIEDMHDELVRDEPLHMTYRVNSGSIDPDSWLYRAEEGGGMLVGEMCHFVDLMQFVSGERPTRVYAESIRIPRSDVVDRDNLSITIRFSEGSIGTLSYHTVGDSAAPKERFEVAGSGRFVRLDDFRRLVGTRAGSTSTSRAWNQDKGQAKQVRQTLDSFRTSGRGPIPFTELVYGMRTVFAAQRSLASCEPVDVRAIRLERETA